VKLATTALLKSIWRAALAVFLLYAAATPAMAELGCFEDVPARQSEQSAHDVSNGVSVQALQEEGGFAQGAAQHCCVSHCAHGFVAKAPMSQSLSTGLGRLGFSPRPVSDPNSAPRDGPDHPPRI